MISPGILGPMMALLVIASCQSNQSKRQKSTPDIHRYLTSSERILFLGSASKVPLYEVLETSSDSSSSFKRDKRSLTKDVSMNLTVFGQALSFTLQPNKHLVSPGFKVQLEPYSKSVAEHLSSGCFYQGLCTSHPDCAVALSLCEGMRGVIETDNGVYLIQPLPQKVWEKAGHVSNSSVPHIVVKQDNKESYNCPHQNKKGRLKTKNRVEFPPSMMHYSGSPDSYPSSADSLRDSSWRAKRSVPYDKEVTIETAVFVDQALHDVMRKAFPTDTGTQLVNYVLTIMNAVQLLFRQSSLGRTLELSLVMLDILERQPLDLTSSDNIDTYLTNFCIWQHKRRMYLRSGQPRWDHALLLSGINMYVVDDRGRRKRHVVGLAPVSGMCNPLNSCTISEGTSFQTVLVAGHEIGHSLGMEHDGPQDGNLCDPNHFIMSPTLGAGKTTWSTCSREYLEKFLRSNQAYCLSTLNSVPGTSSYPLPDDLPGDKFDADQQCALRYGKGSRRSVLQPPEEVCRILRCETGSHGSGVSFTAHPALEGTLCGRDRWCRAGRCSSRQEAVMVAPQRVLQGGWSVWSAYSNCYSDCVMREDQVVGVMVSRRRCDNPTPQNGGKFCEGSEKRSRICDSHQICSNSRQLPLEQYIVDTCRRASIRDPTIESRGTQFPSSDNSHSCYVWCHKRGGGFMTHGWKVPDGTPCWRPGVKQNRYCVNGKCQAFDCEGESSDGLDELACSASTVSESRESWRDVSDCRSSCMLEGVGFQLVTKDCNSVADCMNQKETFRYCEQHCVASRTVEEYANEVCHRYSSKYPNLLSGRGRQLPSRPGNRHSACVVACQDRVWKDTHYQMDVFEDGMFPYGTDCSGGDVGLRAFCLRGKCLEFDSQRLPAEKDVGNLMAIKKIVKGVWKRDLYNHHPPITNQTEKRQTQKKSYQWGVTVSDCTAPCGGGKMYISIFCHIESQRVPSKMCSGATRPVTSGWHACNIQACAGSWRVGNWASCSSNCGQANRSRAVLCVKPMEDRVFSLIDNQLCPSTQPPQTETCILPPCS